MTQLPRYRFIAAHLGAPHTKIAELPLHEIEYTRMLNGAGPFSAKLKMPTVTSSNGTPNANAKTLAALWKEATDHGTTCVYVLRDNTPLGVWAIWNREYNAANQTVSINGAELFSYFRRRGVEGGTFEDTITYSDTSPMSIAVSLLANANDINASIDWTYVGPSNPTTRGYAGTEAKSVGDAVQELADLESPDGFEFRTDVLPDLSRVIRIRHELGQRVTSIVKLGGTTAGYSVQQRGDLRANDVVVLGTNVGSTPGTDRPYGRATSGAFTPMLTNFMQLTDVTSETSLQSYAEDHLLLSLNQEVKVLDVSDTDVDTQLGVIQPGDLVRLYVPANSDPWHPEGLDETVRMLGYSVKIPDTGGQEIIHIITEAE